MFIEICNSTEEANTAVSYHKKLKRKNVKKRKVNEVVVGLVTEAAPKLNIKGIHYEAGDDVWIVTADGPGEGKGE